MQQPDLKQNINSATSLTVLIPYLSITKMLESITGPKNISGKLTDNRPMFFLNRPMGSGK
jgi:hypothetical protein